jgi:PTS system N-acetylglucosamine-specific IIC component
MFLAPVLYGIHAVLTGISMALMHALNVHLGFGFSAGLFDYVLNYSQATRPLMLLPVGLGYFALYFGLFRYFILRFNLQTLGREADEIAPRLESLGAATPALAWVAALGQADNLRTVEACTTRLRLVVSDAARLDEAALKNLGARGVLRLGDGAVQVVVGPIADQLASEIRAALRQPSAGIVAKSGQAATGSSSGEQSPPDPALVARVMKALGGRTNIAELRLSASRVCVQVHDPAVVDEGVLRQATRGVARPIPASVHLVLGPAANRWFADLKGS